MHQSAYIHQINEEGFAVIPHLISHQTIHDLLTILNKVELGPAVRKKGESIYAIRHLFSKVPQLKTLVHKEYIRQWIEPILGTEAKVVRAILFDKSQEANWKVSWHQDLTIAVKKKQEVEGFTAWSEKAGVLHVQPPVSILENMLSLRLHLDDCSLKNGALSVIPGSHRRGRLNSSEIQILRQMIPAVSCPVPSGGVVIMRPLLLHASAASITSSHRRVLHFEYAVEPLPGGLEWYEAI